jgi:hypothetical protein
MIFTSRRFLSSIKFSHRPDQSRALKGFKSVCYCSLATAMLCIAMPTARAVTITFKEDPNEGPVRTIVEAQDCTGCLDIVQQGGQETGNASFLAPPQFFVGFPAGQVSQFQALLVEPANIRGEVAGSISDRVLLTVNSPSDLSQRVQINVGFASDADNNVSFPAANSGAVTETGKLQDISSGFRWYNSASGGAGGPFTLPSNLAIQVQSDVVPEPSTTLLLIAGLVAAIAAGSRRLRAH